MRTGRRIHIGGIDLNSSGDEDKDQEAVHVHYLHYRRSSLSLQQLHSVPLSHFSLPLNIPQTSSWKAGQSYNRASQALTLASPPTSSQRASNQVCRQHGSVSARLPQRRLLSSLRVRTRPERDLTGFTQILCRVQGSRGPCRHSPCRTLRSAQVRTPLASIPSSLPTQPLSCRVTKVYESETYDYPTQIQESITELGTTIGQGITNFAAANLKGTNLPTPAPVSPTTPQHKTLPHAIGRAATNAAAAVSSTAGTGDDKLGKALHAYSGAWEKIADARVEQDINIRDRFLLPWQTTLSTSIAVAMKARQAVRVSRLELDAAKQT